MRCKKVLKEYAEGKPKPWPFCRASSGFGSAFNLAQSLGMKQIRHFPERLEGYEAKAAGHPDKRTIS